MAEKTKSREIIIVDKLGTFNTFFKKWSKEKENFDFEGLSALRKLLSNEKAKLMYTIKENNPKSIYELAKILGRDFKAVCMDIKLLERFGFIDMIAEKSGNRERLRPVLTVDSVNITIKI